MDGRIRAGVPTTHRDQLPATSRYELLVKIASGGMATVYVGRLTGAVGFTRVVAIKRAHSHLLEDPAFKKMLIAEAKLASRIHHPNVVSVLDVEETEGELLLVMDYIEGAALSELVGARDDAQLSARLVVRILLDACAGLHAAHELLDDDGKRLGLVHRDISPHNILVGVDGITRIADFGIAKASTGHTTSNPQTATGALKGKVGYMAPEYVESGRIDARGDVFALGVVAWEAFTRTRLFRGSNEVETLKLALASEVPAPSTKAPWLGRALDAVLLKALARDPDARFASAADLAEAIEAVARREELLGSHAQVGEHVRALAHDALERRRDLVRDKTGVMEVASSQAAAEPSRTMTLPLGHDGAPVAASAEHTGGTLGSGVSAKRVREVRNGSRLGWKAAAAVLGIAALGLAIGTVAMKRGTTRATPSSTAIPAPCVTAPAPPTTPTTSTTTVVAAPTTAPNLASVGVPSGSSAGGATASSSIAAKTPAKPAKPTKPLATGIARVFPSGKAPENAPTATATADKAPPNPYGP
jgi:serine/threonine-protein kinase